MISIFTPSIIKIEPLKFEPASDAQAISSDWQQVGSYIKEAYANFSTKD